jgi:hypothetical protein
MTGVWICVSYVDVCVRRTKSRRAAGVRSKIRLAATGNEPLAAQSLPSMIPWMRCVGLICCRRAEMFVYARTAASSALMPSHGAPDAWALQNQHRSEVEKGMLRDAGKTDVCPVNSTSISWIARLPGMSNIGSGPGPGWDLPALRKDMRCTMGGDVHDAQIHVVVPTTFQ